MRFSRHRRVTASILGTPTEVSISYGDGHPDSLAVQIVGECIDSDGAEHTGLDIVLSVPDLMDLLAAADEQ